MIGEILDELFSDIFGDDDSYIKTGKVGIVKPINIPRIKPIIHSTENHKDRVTAIMYKTEDELLSSLLGMIVVTTLSPSHTGFYPHQNFTLIETKANIQEFQLRITNIYLKINSHADDLNPVLLSKQSQELLFTQISLFGQQMDINQEDALYQKAVSMLQELFDVQISMH